MQAQSPLPTVLAAVETLRRLSADAVVALGGGSAVVTSRAATILLAEDQDIRDICTQFPPGKEPLTPKLPHPKLPQFIIPTTPTTAYGKVGTAVVDTDTGLRLTLFDRKTLPQAIFVHPALSITAPAKLTLGAALNAFVMAIEGVESPRREPLAEALLFQALRLLRRRMRHLGTELDGVETRGELMLAALMAGQGTNYTSGSLASIIGHVAGARYRMPNGVVNAILLPHTLRFNASVTGDSLAAIPQVLGMSAGPCDTEAAVKAIEFVLDELPMPRRLRDLGADKASLTQLAHDAESDWYLHQNPRHVRNSDELLDVLQAAW